MALVKWNIDPAKSKLKFSAKNIMVIDVIGQFDKIEGSATTEDEDFLTAKITFKAQANSINTGNEQRDVHLKAIDFFDAQKFPVITFKSTLIERLSEEEFMLYGDICIRDITQQIKLNVEWNGIKTEFSGGSSATFLLKGMVNRKDYGLVWNSAIEAGNILLSDEIVIFSEIVMIKQI